MVYQLSMRLIKSKLCLTGESSSEQLILTLALRFKISGKAAVMEMGLANYNQECRNIVMTYAEEWRVTIGRLGRWIDFDNDYKVGQLFDSHRLMSRVSLRRGSRKEIVFQSRL